MPKKFVLDIVIAILLTHLGAATCTFEFEDMQCTEAPYKQEARKGRLASLKGPLTNDF